MKQRNNFKRINRNQIHVFSKDKAALLRVSLMTAKVFTPLVTMQPGRVDFGLIKKTNLLKIVILKAKI